ncbi:MAG TPA: DUF2341 domain-containing protein [Methanothermococcus okinawensis]|uniref:DUF2341 domain-containing protein n=1 Tax=Methanothermococcus okinawensis TaxID=155863 RepID=A0A832ZYR2_9EURY|nr:DUF2341 domain-containing protein [Methanothermococcus okinawensis]
MYTSQSMLILTLLLLLTAALFYHTVDLQKKQVIEEMKATSVDLKSSSMEHVVSSSLSPVFNKVLNDASLKVANEGFFNSTIDVVNYLERNTEKGIRNYLDNVSRYYREQGYRFTYYFDIVNITMSDGFTFKIDYVFTYNLSYSNGTINKTDTIRSSQYVTVKTILDAYHYRKPAYIMPIYIYNPNDQDLTDFQVKIILDSTNFDFSKEPDGTGIRFIDKKNNYIPYWVEYWGNDKAILWVKIPKLKARNTVTIYLISTYPRIPESNGDLVFELFDDFEYNHSIGVKWSNFYGDWEYYTVSSDYLLYHPTYNTQVIRCVNAPPVARIITVNNVSLENYIVEVDAWGDNNYGYYYTSPNIMVGYLADPQHFWDTTTHPDAFYTLDLGGRYRNDGYALYTLDGENLWWNSLSYAPYFWGLMICNESSADYWHVYRKMLVYNPDTSPRKKTWYHIKILITTKKEGSKTVKEVNGTYTPLEDYILYNYENPWLIYTTIEKPYGSHFLLGTSWGDHYYGYYQHVYFDNFRVRKYAPKEPKVYVSGNLIRIYPLIYISPPRSYGTHYGKGISHNPYFVEDPVGEHPSIVDMLAGKDTKNWSEGHSIKLIGFYLPENISG